MAENQHQSDAEAKHPFRIAFRGYDRAEVDAHLALVAKQIEQLQVELRKTAAEKEELGKEAERVQDILLAAHRTAEDIRAEASRESEAVLREAESRVTRMDEQMRSRMRELQFDLDKAKKEFDEFLTSARNLAHGFIRKIDETRGLL